MGAKMFVTTLKECRVLRGLKDGLDSKPQFFRKRKALKYNHSSRPDSHIRGMAEKDTTSSPGALYTKAPLVDSTKPE
jgi:hypothetical protein